MPVHVIRHPERECDDTIAHICKVMRKDEQCVIISSDSDFIQLLETGDNRVALFNPVKEKWIDPTDYDYVAWKSLTGDGSDNIPGFKGVGPKRAEKFMTDPQSLEEFLLKDDNKQIFERNMTLIRFEEIDGGLEHSTPNTNWDMLKQALESFGFSSIISDKSWPKFVESFSTIGG
jgi:DNA polymerase-1